jgi:hypothetical protein
MCGYMSRNASLEKGGYNVQSMVCRIIQKAISMSVALVVTACSLFASKEARYLMSAKNRATEADVTQYLGKPTHVTLDKDGPTWMYETRTAVQEGTNNAWTMYDSWRCDSYRLKFDHSGILRDWSQASRPCD